MMEKNLLHYGLPIDMVPRKPKLRHRMDCETLSGIIQRIETRNKEEQRHG